MLPTDQRTPLRRFLEYFGLVEPTVPARPDQPREPATSVRSALVYFGLAEDPDASRYGHPVPKAVDEDIDALRAQVAELEARLGALEGR